jgi:hypothetical protein
MKTLPLTLHPHEWYALEVFGAGEARQHPHCSPILLHAVRRPASDPHTFTLSYLEANDPHGAEEKTRRVRVLQHTSSHLAAQGPDGELMVIFPLQDAWLQTHFPGVDRLMHVISAGG